LLSNNEFIRISLETNLFFQRIMKEHLLLIETNLPPVESGNIVEARVLKRGFEKLLSETVHYANRAISEDAIKSNEFVTPYTLKAEEVTSKLTGASIDTDITKDEYDLVGITNIPSNYFRDNSVDIVKDLNQRSINLLEQVIDFKKKLLAKISECELFISLYFDLIVHITREAEYYLAALKSLQNREMPKLTLCEELNFWSNIMGEHASFIDGLLDPTEKGLKQTAMTFTERFERLVDKCVRTPESQIIQESLQATNAIQNFKRTATEGLLNCEIKSIIQPLLADHVLREANHYLRLLRAMD
jgi:hypothetical protein